MQHQIFRPLVFLIPLLACHWASAWYPHGQKYENWQKDRPLTFGAWHNCTTADGRVEDRIARFKAAGLNDFLWIKANHTKWYRAAHEAGLSWRTSMRGSHKSLSEIVKATPGCAAIMTAYGPYDTEDELEDLAEWAAWSRKAFPDLISYAILLDRAFDYDRYIEICTPDILAVEKFPIGADGIADAAYFAWLAKVASVARRNHLPLWVTVQSFEKIVAKPRLPSFAASQLDEATMRLQAFLSLAHGAAGMHFFMYYGYELSMVVDLGTADPGSPGSGLPTKYENTVRTRSWYAVRDMAPEVLILGRALLNLRSTGPVTYAGVVPENSKAFEGHGKLLSASVANDAAGPLAVGLFDDREAEQYFMVVNLVHGPRTSKLDAARTVQLTFKDDVETIERLSRHTGLVETLATNAAEDGSRFVEFHLEGGTGDLFKWANGKPWTLRPREATP